MLADVPYDEMELYEIGEVRQHQKSLYEEKINGLQELVCDLYGVFVEFYVHVVFSFYSTTWAVFPWT
jgi:hypothetical protein